jgi:hypothetical protein
VLQAFFFSHWTSFFVFWFVPCCSCFSVVGGWLLGNNSCPYIQDRPISLEEWMYVVNAAAKNLELPTKLFSISCIDVIPHAHHHLIDFELQILCHLGFLRFVFGMMSWHPRFLGFGHR